MPKTMRAVRAAAAAILAALLLRAPLQAQQWAAIMEPSGNAHVTTMQKKAVMGALREGMVTVGAYRFVTRERIDATLREHGFQRNGLTDEDSRKRLGKLLNADLILVTDMESDGREMNVTVQIIGVETGEILHSGFEAMNTTASMVLVERITEMVQRIMKKQRVAASGGAARATQGDVYAINRYGNKWSYWKNGQEVPEFRYDGFSVGDYCQNGGDTYRAIYDGRHGVLKNGSLLHYLTSNAAYLIYSVAVSNGTVYAGGCEKNPRRGNWVATVWRNGSVMYRLSDDTAEGGVRSLFVSGGDVYAGGYEGNGSGESVATVWRNGAVLHRWTGAEVTSLFVSGDDVYAGGWEGNSSGNRVATVWKNGAVLHRLNPDGNTQANVRSIFVQGQDVYAAGYEGATPWSGVATVWKNGRVLYRLNNLDNFDTSHLVFVK